MTSTCPCCGQPTPAQLDPIKALAYIPMTNQERQLALVLAENLERYVSRALVIDALWGDDPDGGPNNIDNHISVLLWKLRRNKQLAAAGFRLPYQKTGARVTGDAELRRHHGLRMERISS